MPMLYGTHYTRQELLKRVGDLSQLAGVHRVELREGSEAGVEAAQFQTGCGFGFTVLAGRGMDISSAEYRGQSLCWRSSTGDVHAAFFEPQGLGWLRSFFGGLTMTCGLTNVGSACTDQDELLGHHVDVGDQGATEQLGIHGRVSHIPARDFSSGGQWEGDDYVMWASGRMRETSVFGPNLCLTRKVSARLGEKCLFLDDVVENEGYYPTPHMLLYHINIGFPALDEGSALVSTTQKCTPRDDAAKVGLGDYARFQAPTRDFHERCYFHELKADADGFAYAAIVNKGFNSGEGFGVYIKYRLDQLDHFTEWKMNNLGTYVVGLEPANCLVEGRDVERARGALKHLKPGEQRSYNLEIGVLSSPAEIQAYQEKVKRILAA